MSEARRARPDLPVALLDLLSDVVLGLVAGPAAEELMGARRRAFETLQRGGVQCLDVEAGRLSPALVERYLELKERGLL